MRILSSLARAVVIVSLMGLGACSDLSSREQRLMTGGAVGAVVGTVGTVALGGCIPCGTAIGGAVGAGTGYLIDQIRE